METAKQKAIREAYGEHWEIAKEFVDENGWIDRFKQSAYLNIGNWGIENPLPIINFLGLRDSVGLQYYYDKYRPISLNQIESNIDWIKVETENDLPKDNEVFYFYAEGGKYYNTTPCILITF